jgi:branched-chain amino acid transport system substrate-binding protein
MKKRSILIVATVITAMVLFAVLYNSGRNSNEIRIGVLTSLTGQSARYGQTALNGVQMATDELNAQGGIGGKRIRLLIEDDGSDTARAVSAFRKLATVDRVPIVIGPISSSAAMACSPVANQLHVVLFSPAAATPAFSSPNGYTFRNRVSSATEITTLAEFAFSKLNLHHVSILYVNNDWGVGAKGSFEDTYRYLGGIVPRAEAFDEGATDLRTQLTKLNASSPDAIFLVGQGTEGGYALRQAHELAIKRPFLSVLSIQRTDVIQIAGNAANGVIYAAPQYDPRASEAATRFNEHYRVKYGEDSDLFAGNGYDAMMILAKVIRTDGIRPDAIRTALPRVKDYPGVTGATSFDGNGDVAKPIGIMEIRDGQFVPFGASSKPASTATAPSS